LLFEFGPTVDADSENVWLVAAVRLPIVAEFVAVLANVVVAEVNS
jgi:hypothetical protein